MLYPRSYLGHWAGSAPGARPRRARRRSAITLWAIVATIGPGAIVGFAQPAPAASGGISTIAGTGAIGENGDGILATSATIDNPQGLTIDAHGNALIADSGNSRVRVVAVSATNPGYPLEGCAGPCTWTVGDIYIIAGAGAAGYNGDGLSVATAQLNAPTDVAVDTAGNPVIADTGNERVRVVAVSTSNPGYPVLRWAVGNLYTIAGNGPGSFHYTGDGILSTVAQLFDPERVTVDSHGNPIIADTGNSRLRVVAVSASNPGYPLAGCKGPCTWAVGDIYTIAGTDTAGYNGDGLSATGAQSNAPKGIALDGAGNVLFADSGNHRARVVAVSPSNPGYPTTGWIVGDIYTIAGSGSFSYTTDGIPAASGRINHPGGVTVDSHGNPLIADTGNSRLRIVAVSPSNPGYPLAGCTGRCTWMVGDIYTVAGDGTASYNGDGISATSAQINLPAAVVASNGSVYIADTGNSRVRKVEVSAPLTAPCAPRSVSAAPGNRQAVVRWVAPSCNGGSAVTGYVVTPHLGSSTLAARTFSAKTTAVFSGLTVKKTYRFTVAAKNAIGTGPASALSNAVVVGSPSASTGVRAARVKSGQLKVTFTPGANNGAPISRYTAVCASSNGGVTRSKSGASSPVVVAGLTARKTYRCTVSATNRRGTGPPSSPSAPVNV